jgi:hypothetical protein
MMRRRTRLGGFLAATAACALFVAPSFGLPIDGLVLVSVCTAHGVRLHPVGKGKENHRDSPLACHAACALPRKARLARSSPRGGCPNLL